jgi:hypothetical protein
MDKRLLSLIQIGVFTASILNCSVLAQTDVQVIRTTTLDPIVDGAGTTIVVPDGSSTRQTIIESSRTSVPSTSTKLITEKPVLRLDYQHRLDLLKEQMDNAITKGWLNAADASIVQNDYSGLVSSFTVVRAHDFPPEEAQTLEKQFTGFNIELSDKMAAGQKVR